MHNQHDQQVQLLDQIVVPVPPSLQVLRQIQQEAEFFAIAGLLAAVKQKLLERRVRVEIHVERFRHLARSRKEHLSHPIRDV